MLDHRSVAAFLHEVADEHPDDPAVTRMLEASRERSARTWEDLIPLRDLTRLAGRRRVNKLFGQKLPTRGGAAVAPPAGVERLIEHCASMSDRALRNDFEDAVLVEASSDLEREQLAAYYQARTKHPTFKPGSWTASNHRAVVAAWRVGADRLLATTVKAATTAASCKACGRDLRKGSRAETCGPRCRKAHSRAAKV